MTGHTPGGPHPSTSSDDVVTEAAIDALATLRAELTRELAVEQRRSRRLVAALDLIEEAAQTARDRVGGGQDPAKALTWLLNQIDQILGGPR